MKSCFESGETTPVSCADNKKLMCSESESQLYSTLDISLPVGLFFSFFFFFLLESNESALCAKVIYNVSIEALTRFFHLVVRSLPKQNSYSLLKICISLNYVCRYNVALCVQ